MKRALLSPANLWSMVRESIGAWVDDFAPSMGAAIAYYTAFSIAPLLVIVIAIAGWFFGQEAASGQIYAQLAGLIGEEGAKAVEGLVQSASDPGKGAIATIVGVVLLMVGATTVFNELQTDLDRIWKAPAAKKPEGLWGMIRSRILSLGLVVSIGFLLLVSMVVSATLAALGKWWGGVFEDFEWLMHLLNFVVSFGVITVLFALMYKILPRVKIGWRDVWIGSIVTAALFTIGKFVVGLYLGKSSVASGFGAAGSLVVLLVWVYYSAQIFLLGAEFTWVYAHRFGSRVGKDQPATAKETLATTSEPGGEAARDAAGSGTRPATGSGARPGAVAGTQRPGAAAAAGAHARAAHAAHDAAAADGRRDAARAAAHAAPTRGTHAAPAMHEPGLLGLARRHPGMTTGAALLLGAVAGELLKLRDASAHRGPRALHALARELRDLRSSRVSVSSNGKSWRLFGRT